ncbi:hypothetical protein UMC2_34311 [[Clostridium] sordellii]|uniref:DUF4274 domain-containing protein n=1 Tax=Paraclostridium sordellii TaxID=1505 RepID=UPI000543ABC2|nr:DUF4274 domain-containing protein [Paeniclostridium sordellii]CEK36561.1 hypothetical protein UMC2_34311 [[Clostridium] sordellii] [Paeniclostridium sordellii]
MNLRKEIEGLLYSTDKENTLEKIKEIEDNIKLHILASNYNWNNGFEIPTAILSNKNCDKATALVLFFDADGIRVLEDIKEVENSKLKEWSNFIISLYKRINDDDFNSEVIKFIPNLSKVQIFRIKKKNPNINKSFIVGTKGIL